MPESTDPTPDEPAAVSTPAAPAPPAADAPATGPDDDEPRRTKLQIALIGAGSALLVALIGLAGALVTRGSGGGGGGADAGPTSPPPTVVTTAPTTAAPPAGDTPCAPLKKAHGFSAGLVFPCPGGTLTPPYPVITLKVPAYPEAKGDGQLWLAVRILSDGKGMPLADKPLYAVSPIDAGHAQKVGATTWTKDVQIYQSCHDYGPAQILTYWLSDSGAHKAASWAPGVPITVPPGSVKLDEVTVNMQPGGC